MLNLYVQFWDGSYVTVGKDRFISSGIHFLFFFCSLIMQERQVAAVAAKQEEERTRQMYGHILFYIYYSFS
jgi:hypothetical protein